MSKKLLVLIINKDECKSLAHKNGNENPIWIWNDSPIKINGEGAITYEVVQDYMASKINVAYVEKDSAEEHLREIWSNIIITADMFGINGKVKFMVHQQTYQYGGIRSAINYVYILERVQIPE